MEQIVIYLGDLCYVNESGFSKDSLPLGIGTIASFCKKIHSDKIDIRLFITHEELINAILRKKPNIVGLANFEWSENLTKYTFDEINKIDECILKVTGGANISPHSLNVADISKKRSVLDSEKYCRTQDESLLDKFDMVDYFIHGEAERPFANLIGEYVKHKGSHRLLKMSTIPGCSPVINKSIVWGPPEQDIYDLDEIPSPYEMGLYDELFSKYSLIPQIETNRGCPFKCTFCTVGSWATKIRKHSPKYVENEIKYLHAKSKSNLLRIADSNFGVIKQDINIAKFMYDYRKKTGYPTGIRLYTAESGSTERLKKIMDYLGEMIPLNLSFQSMANDVVVHIKRKNRPDKQVREISKYACENNLMLSSELIMGLPGETYDSFLSGFDDLVARGFESLVCNPLILIKGADLDTSYAINRYNYQIKYSLIGNNVKKYNDNYCFEYSKLPVSSNTYSEEDYFKMFSFSYFIFLTYRAGWYREIFTYILEYGIRPSEIFEEIYSNECYPLFNESLNLMIKKAKESYFETIDDLEKKIRSLRASEIHSISSYDDIFNYRTTVFLCCNKLNSPTQRKYSILEVINAIKKIMHIRGIDCPDKNSEILEELSLYTAQTMISAFENPSSREIKLKYDIPKWINSANRRKLHEYFNNGGKKYMLSLQNPKQHSDFKEINHVKTYNRSIVYFYETMVGSNLKYKVDMIKSTSDDIEPVSQHYS